MKGFYFAMVDFAPALQSQNDVIPMPSSPITPKLPTTPTSPAVIRRMSSSDAHASSRPDAMRRRRESSAKSGDGREVKGEATMRGVRDALSA